MSLISIKDLTFNYDGSYDNIFENVSLQLDTDWKLGLVGRNGQGKTTLFKLLLNQLEYNGKITSTVEFEYFPPLILNQDLFLHQVLEEVCPNYEEWRLFKELNYMDFGELDLYRPFSSYSKGEQTKIMLAVLFSKEGAFLLIDEPTNHLDRIGRECLSEYLKTKRAFIIISHDKRFLDNCIDHVLSINRQDIVLASGNMTTFLENKANRDKNETSINERLKTEIVELKEASRRQTEWSNKAEKTKIGGGKDVKSGLRPDRGAIGARAAKLMKRAIVFKNRMDDSIDEKSSLLKNVDRADKLSLEGENFFKDELLKITDLVIKYGDKQINKPLSLTVSRGEKVSIVGKNGCGKTSMLKCVLGKVDNFCGNIEISSRLKVSYVSQDTSFVKGSIAKFCEQADMDRTKLVTMLSKLGFAREQLDKRAEDFSEGQKKKLLIAKSLCEEANLYIWDEPLNYIDIISRGQIKDMLNESSAAMIFVEHDADFCAEISTKEITVLSVD